MVGAPCNRAMDWADVDFSRAPARKVLNLSGFAHGLDLIYMARIGSDASGCSDFSSNSKSVDNCVVHIRPYVKLTANTCPVPGTITSPLEKGKLTT